MVRLLRSRRVHGPPRYYRGIPVVNLLPSEGRALSLEGVRRRARVLGWIALVLVLVMEVLQALSWYPELRETEQESQTVNAQRLKVERNVKRIEQMEAELARLRGEQQRLQEDWTSLVAQPSGTLPALGEVLNRRIPEITLRSIEVTQVGRMTVQGETSDIGALPEWQGQLEASEAIARVLSVGSQGGTGSPENPSFGFALELLVKGGSLSTTRKQP